MKKQSLYFPLLILSTLPVTAVIAADGGSLDGEALYKEKACVICHGDAGRNPTMPYYPKLAGQQKVYLFEQTKAIQVGERKNGFAKVMVPFMGVTEEEMRAIAEYLSRQTP